MERVMRLMFLGLFILGFVGAVASADPSRINGIIDDIRQAQNINQGNQGVIADWNPEIQSDIQNDRKDSISQIENILKRVSNDDSDTVVSQK